MSSAYSTQTSPGREDFLAYEAGVVDNPYGVEGCMGEKPTLLLCRQFVTSVLLSKKPAFYFK
ncbi:hypothetical protein C6380_17330 [Pseudomonas syringae pv. actinidiae]|nr:hypothetical protein C6380_17330 [Pseudomonas syringae pv. actinidiae]RJY23826.1 hypothetical protein C6381_02075 [Pseudomonas syringae pv. actinidiae]